MSNTKHTPGPWMLNDLCDVYADAPLTPRGLSDVIGIYRGRFGAALAKAGI